MLTASDFEHCPDDPNAKGHTVFNWTFWSGETEDYINVPRKFTDDIETAKEIAAALVNREDKGFEAGRRYGKMERSTEIRRLIEDA